MQLYPMYFDKLFFRNCSVELYGGPYRMGEEQYANGYVFTTYCEYPHEEGKRTIRVKHWAHSCRRGDLDRYREDTTYLALVCWMLANQDRVDKVKYFIDFLLWKRPTVLLSRSIGCLLRLYVQGDVEKERKLRKVLRRIGTFEEEHRDWIAPMGWDLDENVAIPVEEGISEYKVFSRDGTVGHLHRRAALYVQYGMEHHDTVVDSLIAGVIGCSTIEWMICGTNSIVYDVCEYRVRIDLPYQSCTVSSHCRLYTEDLDRDVIVDAVYHWLVMYAIDICRDGDGEEKQCRVREILEYVQKRVPVALLTLELVPLYRILGVQLLSKALSNVTQYYNVKTTTVPAWKRTSEKGHHRIVGDTTAVADLKEFCRVSSFEESEDG